MPKIIDAGNYTALATTTPVAIIAANNDRASLFIQNRGLQNVFITFGSIPTDGPDYASAILIPPNGFFEPQHVPVNTIYAVAAAGTNKLSIVLGIWKEIA